MDIESVTYACSSLCVVCVAVLGRVTLSHTYGGDEFILLLQNEVDVASVESIVRKLINVVSIPMRLDGVDIRISASVGVAFYPAHGGSPDQLISQADNAMYRAKHQADGHYYISPLDSQS